MKNWGSLAILSTALGPPKPGPHGHTQKDREHARFLISSGQVVFSVGLPVRKMLERSHGA